MFDAPQMYRWKDPGLPPNAPSLQVFFLQEPQVNLAATEATGIQTYDSVLIAYVSPINSKSNVAHEIERTTPDGQVITNQRAAARFGEQVKLFKAGLGAETQGTPLRDLVTMTPATIMNLKARGIHTVEMLGDMPDSAGHDLMGFWELRDRARKHIELREKNAPALRAQLMEEKHAAETADLRRQIDELKALIDPPKRGPGRPPKVQDEAA